MADNIQLNSGTGGSICASDEISGVHFPRSKIVLGNDGINNGDVSSSNPMPVTWTGSLGVDTELVAAAALADATANPTVTSVGTFVLFFNGTTWDRARGDTTNGLDVDVTRVQGNVTVVQSTSSSLRSQATLDVGGTVVSGANPVPVSSASTLSVAVVSALPAGTNNIGDVDVLTFPSASSMTTGQVSVGTSATQIIASNASRKALTIYNNGTAAIFIGGASVTTSNGHALPAGASFTFGNAILTAAIFGIVASGTQTATYIEW